MVNTKSSRHLRFHSLEVWWCVSGRDFGKLPNYLQQTRKSKKWIRKESLQLSIYQNTWFFFIVAQIRQMLSVDHCLKIYVIMTKNSWRWWEISKLSIVHNSLVERWRGRYWGGREEGNSKVIFLPTLIREVFFCFECFLVPTTADFGHSAHETVSPLPHIHLSFLGKHVDFFTSQPYY